MIFRLHAVPVDAENTVRAPVDLSVVQKERSGAFLKFGRISDAGRKLSLIEGKLTDPGALLSLLDCQKAVCQRVYRITVSCGQLAVSVDMQLFPMSQDKVRILHVKQLVQGDMQKFAQSRNQVDIRPGSSVLPVGDGIPGDAEPCGQFLLLHSGQLAVVADPLTDDGKRRFYCGLSGFHVNDTAGSWSGPVKRPARHSILLKVTIVYSVTGHTPASPKVDTGILSGDFWGSKRRIPVSATGGWPGCDL